MNAWARRLSLIFRVHQALCRREALEDAGTHKAAGFQTAQENSYHCLSYGIIYAPFATE